MRKYTGRNGREREGMEEERRGPFATSVFR